MSAYIDDLLIASDTMETHILNLIQLFERLSAYQIHINPEKCIFGHSPIEFLSYIVDSNSTRSLPSKIDAIQCTVSPTSVKKFYCFVNFYRRFID